jgi:hypothetical protein
MRRLHRWVIKAQVHRRIDGVAIEHTALVLLSLQQHGHGRLDKRLGQHHGTTVGDCCGDDCGNDAVSKRG